MIEVNRVSYTTASDKRPVLTDVNMTLGPGLYLLTGERASGTTELMQVMASLRRPQSGEVLINGLDVAGRRPSVLSRLAYMGPDTVFPVNTIAEMTTSHAIFYPHFSPQALDENLIRLRIGADDRLTELADADRHLVMAAYLLSLNTDLLLLDDIRTGLSLQQYRELRAMIRENLSGQRTAVLSQVNSDMSTDFDGLIFMRAGRVALVAETRDILAAAVTTVTPMRPAEAIFAEFLDGAWHAVVPASAVAETYEPFDFAILCRALSNPEAAERVSRLINPRS